MNILNNKKISGIIDKVVYHNEQNGWSVLRLIPFDSNINQNIEQKNDINNHITVVVHQAKVFAGASIDIYGEWTNHHKFGEQFKATKIIEKKPASIAALEKYLGSGLIKGVGIKTARKIIKFFGEETLDVFENRIEDLLAVPSIAQKKLQLIKLSWEEHKAIKDVMMFLQSHGISTLFATKIFKTYRNNSIKVVSENPYRLAKDIYGIGFFSADKIALNLGFQTEGKERIKAGVKHVLANSREDGHCYLTLKQIIDKTFTLLSIKKEELIFEAIKDLSNEDEIKKRKILEEDFFYNKSIYWDEEYISKKVLLLLENNFVQDEEKEKTENKIKVWINKYCDFFKIKLSDEQINSVKGIVQNSFSILSGGPGCGKTTTIKVLVKLLRAMQKKIILAAPTGRAAQRMSEVIGEEAKTIHRLLEWNVKEFCFKKDETNSLDTEFLIIDESSMLDVHIFAGLLRAVPNKSCQVLLIGDPNQLPSVGAGAILQDLISSQCINNFQLNKIFRQAEESYIIKYAHQINDGNFPKIYSPLAQKHLWEENIDCFFVDSEEATREQLKFIASAKNIISKLKKNNKECGFNSNKEQQVKDQQVKEQLIGEINNINSKNSKSDDINKSEFIIPEKFQHVDLEKLAECTSLVEELKEVIKTIHPFSSLHFGFTAIDMIKYLYTKSIKKKMGYNCEIQILSPQVRGSLGVNNLNQIIQSEVNPIKTNKNIYSNNMSFNRSFDEAFDDTLMFQSNTLSELKVGEKFFRLNDRVIQTRNNYDLNVFNGDIGNIIEIDLNEYTCVVEFGDQNKRVKYQREDLPELSLAYAITIHKSQGSEFEVVIIPVVAQHFKMLFRNLIYTGLTRAKKLAVFVGSRKALSFAIRNIDNRKRQTTLSYLLNKDNH